MRLDGKYLLRTNDPKMSAEDIALGYKQLLEVERGWRLGLPGLLGKLCALGISWPGTRYNSFLWEGS